MRSSTASTLIDAQNHGCHTIPMMRALGIVLILVLSACGVGQPSESASGAEIYNQLCANCHGADLGGGLGPPLGPDSNSADRPDEFLEIAILNGRGSMPSFSSSLDEEQLDRLIGYLREVQQE